MVNGRRHEFLELQLAEVPFVGIAFDDFIYLVALEQVREVAERTDEAFPVLALPVHMKHVGRYGIVAADIVGQCLGTVLGEGHVVRHATLGRGVTGDVDTDNPDIGILLYQFDGVGNGVQFGTVVLEPGQDIVAVLPELQPRGTGFGTHLHRFGFRGYGIETVIRDKGGQNATPQTLPGLTLAAVGATVYLLAELDPPVEHPPLVGHGSHVVVLLVLAAVAYDYL